MRKIKFYLVGVSVFLLTECVLIIFSQYITAVVVSVAIFFFIRAEIKYRKVLAIKNSEIKELTKTNNFLRGELAKNKGRPSKDQSIFS